MILQIMNMHRPTHRCIEAAHYPYTYNYQVHKELHRVHAQNRLLDYTGNWRSFCESALSLKSVSAAAGTC